MSLLEDAGSILAELVALRARVAASDPHRLPAIDAALLHIRAVVHLCEGEMGHWQRALVASKVLNAAALVDGLLRPLQ